MPHTYDAETDILAVHDDKDAPVARSEEHPWGLIEFDADGKAIGAEIWKASELTTGVATTTRGVQ